MDGLILRDRVRSADIQEERGVKLLLPGIEEPDEVVRRPLGCLLEEVSNWEETPGQILALVHWLVWECLGVPPPPGELEEVGGEQSVWARRP